MSDLTVFLIIILNIVTFYDGTIATGPFLIHWTSLFTRLVYGTKSFYIGTRVGFIKYIDKRIRKLDKNDNI